MTLLADLTVKIVENAFDGVATGVATSVITLHAEPWIRNEFIIEPSPGKSQLWVDVHTGHLSWWVSLDPGLLGDLDLEAVAS